MNVSLGTVALLASVLISGVAAADDAAPTPPAADTGAVTAEKASPIKSVLPGAYASIELRHVGLRAFNDDQTIHNDSAGVLFIPKIGTTLFNDKVDTSFTYKFLKEASSDEVTKYDAYNETQWNWLDGKINDKSPYNFGPYALTDLMTQGTENWQYADIGLYGELNYEFNIPTGAISTMTYFQPMVQVLSNEAANTYDRVPVANNTNKGADELNNFGLTGSGTDPNAPMKGTQHDDTYLLNFGFGVKYKPAAVAGLSVGLGIDFMETWNPVYAENNVGGVPTQQLDHYAVQALTMNRFVMGYKINDKLSLSEQLREFVNGYDQGRVSLGHQDQTNNVGPYRFENRLALTATLL